MGPTAAIETELKAALEAGDAARVRHLEAGLRIVTELLRWVRADPALGGLALDAMPRVPVRPGAGSG